MVATYRSSDTDPKERFVHQQAGDGGYGDSSYIDLVAFREKDANTAWTSASDGTLEERLYYCQNQHADVVALITSAGVQREMDRYSAYGVPFGLPTGDCDSDGDCDTTDRNQVQTWINNSSQYDVRGDLDLDGDADSTDKTNLRDNFEGVTLGRGALSASVVGNRRGLAGYELTLEVVSSYNIRHRILDSAIGIWNSRDPLHPQSGPFLYAYASICPVSRVDSMGTIDCPTSTGTGGQTPGSAKERCCANALAADPILLGKTMCCDGKVIICVFGFPELCGLDGCSLPASPGGAEGTSLVNNCICQHEQSHAGEAGSCKGKGYGDKVEVPRVPPGSEERAREVEVQCLLAAGQKCRNFSTRSEAGRCLDEVGRAKDSACQWSAQHGLHVKSCH